MYTITKYNFLKVTKHFYNVALVELIKKSRPDT